MTGSLEIKITISEFVTPALFQAMAAVSNPRQRAALLKRLAEDALRGNLTPAQVAPLSTSSAAARVKRPYPSLSQPQCRNRRPL